MKEHLAVVDLGYGDAGKGTIVDAICSTSSNIAAVIRFNGGAQAAHNVITEDGRHHTFAQFGSGTLRGVPTHLSRFMIVDPLALASEARSLGNPFHLLTVDADALLATPWHRAANRRREVERGAERHGSCGMGVGETQMYALKHPDAPRVADVLTPTRLTIKLRALADFYDMSDIPIDDVVDAFVAFGEAVRIVGTEHTDRLLAAGPCVFEGAQGVLLDEWRGWHPYTTWSTTTFDNIGELCPSFRRLGVVRTYTTRHGAGPFVTEAPDLDLPEAHNGRDDWQGAFRTGHFDAVAHRYAVEVAGGVDALAVTHLDAPARCPDLKICTAYRTEGEIWDRIEPGPHRDLAYQERLAGKLAKTEPATSHRPVDWKNAISELLGAPVEIESHGPRSSDKRIATLSK
ncbi:adenylosuccinate synthetase [Actinoplanes sp. OR16]|uniref:adenylosuccinate synthetase n=1 Tax=Actinoplanes sp. OR16 TaxID=946334 RepID=UPI000F71B69D|nr:adenylosuccinate synthetase [Actinoplanes sp. OR16]BBH63805.1 adenylosuccinate synthetase [Actinoplanes sp. OR16]